MFLIRFIYWIHIIKVWYGLLEVKKGLAMMPRLVSFRGLIQNFQLASPFHMGVPPGKNVLLKPSYPASNFTKSQLEYLIH